MRIQIDGSPERFDLGEFAMANDLDAAQYERIHLSLLNTGFYYGGGGAEAEYTLTWPGYAGAARLPVDFFYVQPPRSFWRFTADFCADAWRVVACLAAAIGLVLGLEALLGAWS